MAPERCPRCRGRLAFDPLDRDRFCLMCGHRAYGRPPLPFVAERQPPGPDRKRRGPRPKPDRDRLA